MKRPLRKVTVRAEVDEHVDLQPVVSQLIDRQKTRTRGRVELTRPEEGQDQLPSWGELLAVGLDRARVDAIHLDEPITSWRKEDYERILAVRSSGDDLLGRHVTELRDAFLCGRQGCL